MDHLIDTLVLCLIFIIRFTLCIIDDTVLSDSWDDCEAFHADFSSSDEMSNECEILENQSIINEPNQSDESPDAMQTEVVEERHFITTSPLLIDDSNEWEELIREWQYKVPEETLIDTTIPHHPQPLNQSESTTPLLIDDSYEFEELLSELQHKVPEETLIETTIPHQPQLSNQGESTSEDVVMTEPQKKETEQRVFVTIGQGSKDAWGDLSIFKNLNSGISKTFKISKEQEKEVLLSFGDKHQWEELSDYRFQDYYCYWANVCDYFWVKTPPHDYLLRGCYVNTQIFPKSTAYIEVIDNKMYPKSAKLEILRCQCYFYSQQITKPSSSISKFAVHKYRDNEYFILKEIQGQRNSYKITSLLTQVYLPNPQNNTKIMRESNQLVKSRTELQNDTEMISVSTREPRHGNLPRRRFLTIGSRSRTEQRMATIFQNVLPGKSNPQNLSQEQLELKFISYRNINQWKELKKYSLDMYIGYWGNVCDYFWKKPKPDDERFRGCWVKMSYQPHSHVTVVLSHVPDFFNPRKLDVLQCQCYYYIKYQTQPDSNQTDFAIQKYRDNEYFMLDKVYDKRYSYKIVDLLTEVYLPDPVN